MNNKWIITFFAVFIILDCLTGQNPGKKNFLFYEPGYTKVLMNDEVIDYKFYSGGRITPLNFSYSHTGDKFHHYINFHFVTIRMNSENKFNNYDYENAQYTGGYLNYKILYKYGQKSKWGFLAGAGIASNGSNRFYEKQLKGYTSDEYGSANTSACSAILSSNIYYTYNKFILSMIIDFPFVGYYSMPSVIYNYRRKVYSSDWFIGSFGKYLGSNIEFRGVYLINRFSILMHYQLFYEHYRLLYPMKSLTSIFNIGLGINI